MKYPNAKAKVTLIKSGSKNIFPGNFLLDLKAKSKQQSKRKKNGKGNEPLNPYRYSMTTHLSSTATKVKLQSCISSNIWRALCIPPYISTNLVSTPQFQPIKQGRQCPHLVGGSQIATVAAQLLPDAGACSWV